MVNSNKDIPYLHGETQVYVDEDKPEVASATWEKEGAQVRSWLWNSVEPYVSCDMILLPTAYAIWTSVKVTYGFECNIQRI